MADAPSPPWNFYCPLRDDREHSCDYWMLVGARGARGRDPGSGVEAALRMRAHLEHDHGISPEEADRLIRAAL